MIVLGAVSGVAAGHDHHVRCFQNVAVSAPFVRTKGPIYQLVLFDPLALSSLPGEMLSWGRKAKTEVKQGIKFAPKMLQVGKRSSISNGYSELKEATQKFQQESR
jgi:hypothetical protein